MVMAISLSSSPKRGAKQGGQSRSMRIYSPNVGRSYRVLQLSRKKW